jgi:aminopeptidase YwaD
MTLNFTRIYQRTLPAMSRLSFLFLVIVVSIPLYAGPQAKSTEAFKPRVPAAKEGLNGSTIPKVCSVCIRGHMEFLASDALQGRGSGTHDELLTATYVASELRAYGIEPAGDDGGYIQQATLVKSKFSASPELSFAAGGAPNGTQIIWAHGKEMEVQRLSRAEFTGPLQKINLDDRSAEGGSAKVRAGAVVFLISDDSKKTRSEIFSAMSQGAAAVLVTPSAQAKKRWLEAAKELPELPMQMENSGGTSSEDLTDNLNLLAVDDSAREILHTLPDGTVLHFHGHTVDAEKSHTWNAVGILRGSDPSQRGNAILLSAHLDHLGIAEPVNGDNIYNGADDDASGTVAVLELARVLGRGRKPRRTVIFALFGSEELGGLGSTYFREHPPLPLTDIAANVEFEMIGRADPKVANDTLWLSGWERSNLGPELAAHGANLVGDPHPDQHFFQRSDNYVLAKKGVVAQTASSFGLHKDYHQPSDDLAHIDFQHMITAISSLIRPMEWLVNADFRPQWNAGGKP